MSIADRLIAEPLPHACPCCGVFLAPAELECPDCGSDFDDDVVERRDIDLRSRRFRAALLDQSLLVLGTVAIMQYTAGDDFAGHFSELGRWVVSALVGLNLGGTESSDLANDLFYTRVFLGIGYFTALLGMGRGATLGMRVFELRMVHVPTGGRLDVWGALGRQLVAVISLPFRFFVRAVVVVLRVSGRHPRNWLDVAFETRVVATSGQLPFRR